MIPRKSRYRMVGSWIFLLVISLLISCNSNNTTNPPSPIGDPATETEGIPSGVTIEKVVDSELNNDYRKRIERLSDGGSRITIIDDQEVIVLRYLEYEGVILAVENDKVSVQVEDGGQQDLVIPSHVVIYNDKKLGLKPGIEIEWTLDRNGQILSVELDD